MNKERQKIFSTTFQISADLHTKMKMMCLLSHTTMGAFIRAAVAEKVKNMKEKNMSEK